MAELVIYTDSFPYGKSEPFLETEITYLSDAFERIIIRPLTGTGEIRKLPANVGVSEPVANSKCIKITMYLFGLANFFILFSEPALRSKLHTIPFLKAIKYLGYAIWLKKRLLKSPFTPGALHYSYWMNYWAIVLAQLSRGGKINGFVSRAHRYDLYTGTGEQALDFFKPFTINYTTKLYLISENGFRFINNIYPEYSQKYSLSMLGTKDPGFLGTPNRDKILIIVSCSNLKPLKRVELILESLIRLNRIHPDFRVKWFHLGGDGDELNRLVKKSQEELGNSSIQCIFRGNLANSEVIEFYRNQTVDVFLNVSESEGLPVSIMEVQSFGIPVIATSVGGTPEIVTNKNGLLLDVDINPEGLGEAIYGVYRDKKLWEEKRFLSRQNWEQNFSAETNYKLFSSELKSIITIR